MPKTENNPLGIGKEYKQMPVYIIASDDTTGVVESIVNLFGIIDLGGDIIVNGAYSKTINQRGQQVKVRVLDQHQTDSAMRVIGKPIDIRELTRDELPEDLRMKFPDATGGLYCKTQYLLTDEVGKGIYDRLAGGYLDEYSIGFDSIQQEWIEKEIDGKKVAIRLIKEIRLWEYSVVIWGMNQGTTTTSIKSVTLDDIKELVEGVPVKRIGACLDVALREGMSWRANSLLEKGIISSDERAEIDTAFGAAIESFLGALGEIANREMPPPVYESWMDYMSAPAPVSAKEAEIKAGRVLSKANATAIADAVTSQQNGIAKLITVLQSAGAWTDPDDVPDELQTAVPVDEIKSENPDPSLEPGTTPVAATGPDASPSIVDEDELLRLRLQAQALELELFNYGPQRSVGAFADLTA